MLANLKHKIAALEMPAIPAARKFALGVDEVDRILGGGLARACLHEVFAKSSGDEPSATGFALAIAFRAAETGRKIVWIRNRLAGLETGIPYAPGLMELGIDPDDVILVAAKNDIAVLRAALEALRAPALGAVLIDIWGAVPLLDLTTSRRLMLAASRSGVTGFVLRPACQPQSSAALTRWRVAALPSTGLATGFAAQAPSHPIFDISLERHRAGIPPHRWRVEWNRDHKRFDRPDDALQPLPADGARIGHLASAKGTPLSGAVVSLSFNGSAAPAQSQGRGHRRTG